MDNRQPLTKKPALYKTCARCGGAFECRADDISNCACNTIKISDNIQAGLKSRYRDCLCVECLRQASEHIL